MYVDNEFSIKGFVVWSICAFFFLYEFFLRVVIGTFQVSVMHDLNLSFFQFSLLSTTLFFITYGFMQIPVGFIITKLGLKKSLLIGCVACTVSSFGFAYSNSYIYAMIFRFIMGFGASFGFICLLISVREWMPHKYNAIFIGLSQFVGTLGPILATGPLHTLIRTSSVSWRFVFSVLAILGLILSIFVGLFVRSNSQNKDAYSTVQKPETFFASLKESFLRLQPWYVAIFAACIYFTIEYLSENEGRAFLMLKGFTLSSASYALTVSWIGYAIGCPLLGFFSDFFYRRKSIMVVSALLGFVSIVTIINCSNTFFILIAFFILGISASGQSIAFVSIAELVKKQFVAIAYGLTNMIITIIAGINAPVIGLLLDAVKKGKTITLAEYILVFNVLIVISLIACILILFFIKETFCKSNFVSIDNASRKQE